LDFSGDVEFSPVPRLNTLAALLFALVCCPSATRALVVYDTFALGESPYLYVPLGEIAGNDVQYAYPFDMPIDSGNLPLETITLRLMDSSVLADPKGDFTLLLREDDGGTPGAVLEEWTITGDLPTLTNVTFDSVTQPLLLEAATYWLNLKMEGGTSQVGSRAPVCA
jgi:hypothetical protein